MTDLITPRTRVRPPWPVVATVVALTFLGVSSIPSGAVMLIFGTDLFPAAWLDDFPMIDSLVLPGLTLLLGFGAGSLLTAYGVARRPRWTWLHWAETWTGRHWSWLALLLIGLGHLVWIGLEYAYLGADSFLQPTYGLLALLLVTLALTPSLRRWLTPAG